MTQIVFYVFATVLVLSAGMVVSARNPVHSVLFLILAFFNAAGLFLIAGAEFLAMILVIVYVGAVAVLFLFVVMMLDVRFTRMREGLQRYAPFGAAVGGVLFAELALAFGHWRIAQNIADVPHLVPAPGRTNTAALGDVLYTHYVFPFEACGIVLLVAMIGAIVLTLRERPMGRRQNIDRQHERTAAESVEMMALPLGQGVAELGGFRRPDKSYYVASVPGSYGVTADAVPQAAPAGDDRKGGLGQ
ncbi:NADH-quinone oxidoreductase subunit J [Gluconacetobacter azotocaptans]|uniref:NADH-quinone oxidoreductase subunit J n=1 Tax=Gluconacetobacter azotocaptans TaxID=142834 RepID=A0A7W4JUP8_9PROT|nr:NADH-quinone oxidoreductase subunit J [Gluconacetobacter azotocaptans]MBB2191165.1 NADH-quinone oxidoreductase subunit J [Gluconacetobacter azotocaptans]MBM9403216.1 NADH-quinone oxidoreductase subunit J [Gluconacetobacter azotocaptans]GBQ29099.1 NADH-quinone oxidoreductase chain J [Gluconacetobacter azotocaptans DSM 13594]